jgi:hypothetical protein
VLLRQHGQQPLLQLARPLARDDLHDVDPGGGGLEEGLAQRDVDVAVVAEDRVQIQREQGNRLRCARSPADAGSPWARRTVAAYILPPTPDPPRRSRTSGGTAGSREEELAARPLGGAVGGPRRLETDAVAREGGWVRTQSAEFQIGLASWGRTAA